MEIRVGASIVVKTTTSGAASGDKFGVMYRGLQRVYLIIYKKHLHDGNCHVGKWSNNDRANRNRTLLLKWGCFPAPGSNIVFYNNYTPI